MVRFTIFLFLLCFVLFSGPQAFAQATVFLRAGGDITTPGDWGTSANGLSGTLADFTGNNVYNFSNNNTSRTLNSNWNITANSTVNIGDGTNGFTLTYSGSAALGATANLVVNNNGVLDLGTAYNLDNTKTTYNTGSTIVFNSGSGNLASDSYNKVRVAANVNGNNATLTATGDFVVTSGAVLTLDGSSRLDLSGLMDVQGSLSANNSGHIFFTNSGGIELNLNSNTSLLTFDINRSGTYNIYNSLTVVNDFQLSGGLLRLNGNKLTLNGNITFGSGIIRGNSSSELEIGGTGSITNGLNMDPTITEFTNLLRSLTLSRASTTLNLASTLYIYGAITPSVGTLETNGNLVLSSNAFFKARIGPITAAGALTGNVTVNVFKPSGTTNWINLCSGGVSGKTMADWNSSFVITCPTCPDGSTVSNATFTSIYSYDEAATSGSANASAHYVGLPNISTSIDSKAGYWVYLGDGFPNTNAITIPLTGAVNTKNSSGNINLTVTGGAGSENGWNLISNPYPSPILVSAIETAGGAGIDNTSISAYDPDTDGFVTYSSAGANSVIPMGQAFYVRAVSNTALTPDESWKVTTDNNTSLLKVNASVVPTGKNGMPYFFNDFLIDLQSTSVNKSFFTQTYIGFDINATAAYDLNKDAYCLLSPIDPGCPRLFSPVNNEKLMRTVLPVLNGSVSIPLQVHTGYPGTYKLQPINLNLLPSGACVILKDLVNNQIHDLRSGAYSVFINSGALSEQFELQITLQNASMASTQQSNPLCKFSMDGALIASGNGAGPWNYTWKDENANILKYSPNLNTADTLLSLSAGQYLVEVNTVGTCNNASAQFTLIAQTPLPIADFVINTTTVSAQSNVPVSFTNLSQNASDFTWEFGNGVSVSSLHTNYTYNTPGLYTVKLTAGNGACQDFDQKSAQVQVLDMPVGLTQHEFTNEELVLVQEGSGLYLLVNSNENRSFTLSAYNALGQNLIKEKTVRPVNRRIDIQIPSSENLLFVKLSNENKSKTFKVIH